MVDTQTVVVLVLGAATLLIALLSLMVQLVKLGRK